MDSRHRGGLGIFPAAPIAEEGDCSDRRKRWRSQSSDRFSFSLFLSCTHSCAVRAGRPADGGHLWTLCHEYFFFLSSFHQHFGHSLANEEVNKLMNQKTKLTWEMTANEMTMSKLVGSGQDITTELNGDPFYGINSKLYSHLKNSDSRSNSGDAFSSKRRLFFSLCNTYRDIMYCDKKPFYMKGKEDDSSIMDAYIMHALNHIYKTRDIVIKNDAQLSKHENSKRNEIIRDGIYLDQGFTRPKGNVAHMDRFFEDFGTGDIKGDDNTAASLEPQKRAKPPDFEALFGGNNNDHFMIGMKFTK